MRNDDDGARLRLDRPIDEVHARARPIPTEGGSRYWGRSAAEAKPQLIDRWWYVRLARGLGVEPFPLLVDLAQTGVTKSRPGLLRRVASRIWLNHA